MSGDFGVPKDKQSSGLFATPLIPIRDGIVEHVYTAESLVSKSEQKPAETPEYAKLPKDHPIFQIGGGRSSMPPGSPDMSRRNFLRLVTAGTVAAGLGGVVLYNAISDVEQSTFLAKMAEKIKHDATVLFHSAPSQGESPYAYVETQHYQFRKGGSGFFEVYPQTLMALYSLTGDDQLLPPVIRYLDALKLSGSRFDDADSLVLDDMNNPGIGRYILAQEAADLFRKRGVSGLTTNELRVLTEKTHEGRTAQILAPRMYQPDAKAFFGVLPQDKSTGVREVLNPSGTPVENTWITVSQAYFLYPLLHAGVKRGIEELLEPKLHIGEPQNALEQRLVSSPMGINEFSEMIIHSHNRIIDTLVLPDGSSVFKARVNGGVYREALIDGVPGYNTGNPATVTRDHLMLITGLRHAYDLLETMRDIAPAGDAFRISEAQARNIEARERMMAFAKEQLDTALQDTALLRGVLPEYLKLPFPSLRGSVPDIASTAAFALELKYARDSMAPELHQRLTQIAESHMDEMSAQKNPHAGILPAKSRLNLPVWNRAWSASGDRDHIRYIL